MNKRKHIVYSDEKGEYTIENVINQGGFTSAFNLNYIYNGLNPKLGWSVPEDKLKELDGEGLLIWNQFGFPYRKKYIVEKKKKVRIGK